jgi:hypothetical protein
MRVKRIYVTPELITAMLTTGYELGPGLKVNSGVPEDSVLTAIGWVAERRCYAFDFFNSYWPDVPEGDLPPALEVVIEKSSPVLYDALSK